MIATTIQIRMMHTPTTERRFAKKIRNVRLVPSDDNWVAKPLAPPRFAVACCVVIAILPSDADARIQVGIDEVSDSVY